MPSSGARTLLFIESSPAERPSRLVHVTLIESSPAEHPSRPSNFDDDGVPGQIRAPKFVPCHPS